VIFTTTFACSYDLDCVQLTCQSIRRLKFFFGWTGLFHSQPKVKTLEFRVTLRTWRKKSQRTIERRYLPEDLNRGVDWHSNHGREAPEKAKSQILTTKDMLQLSITLFVVYEQGETKGRGTALNRQNTTETRRVKRPSQIRQIRCVVDIHISSCGYLRANLYFWNCS